MRLDEGEARFRLTLTWPKFPPSNDPTEDNPFYVMRSFIDNLWRDYYLDDEEWGDEGTFDAKRQVDDQGNTIVILESTMPEAMGDVMQLFAMGISYFHWIGTSCKFEKIGW